MAALVNRRRVIGFLGFVATSAAARTQGAPKPKKATPMSTRSDTQSVSPALDRYSRESLLGEVWNRPALSTRDRSLVTASVLIARNQTIEMPQVTFHLNKAMDNGLTKSEASELLTHLAFYVGWPNAMSAAAVFKEVLGKRTSAGA
jgi:4-carboxymuconolactone decarboxylase